MPKYYLRVEPVNFETAIYDTNDISTIRGAGFMLLNAFDRLKKQFKEHDIGTSASVGLFAFDADNDAAADKIQQKIITATPITEVQKYASILSAMEKEDSTTTFPQILQKLQANIRWQQYQSPTMILPQDINAEKACHFDGVRPAVEDDQKGSEKYKVSVSVKLRRDRGRDLRQKVYEILLGHPLQYAFTNNLEELATDSKRGNLNGKIAFIHLDGNRFGRARDQKCTDEKLFTRFQNHIQDEMRKTVLSKIINSASLPENNSFRTQANEIRLETLLWGGDEIDWIVPAWQALNVLSLFYQVTARFEKWEGINFTHSAGVVFCHHNLPVLQVRRYARQLCDLAKEGIPTEITDISAEHNRIAFLNLSAFDLIGSDVKDYMKAFYAPAQPDTFIIENAAGNLNEWIAHLKALKGYFPRNKIYPLLKALKDGPENKVNDVLELVKKIVNKQTWEEHLELAIKSLTRDRKEPNRWFLISDLINYVGEDR